MKKEILIALAILLNTICYSQNFTGDYRSYKTSFRDSVDAENNFVEETEFRIAVLINEEQDDGRIVIQDPRIPDKLLIYKVIEYVGIFKDNDIVTYLYKCKTEHLDNPMENTIGFYYPKDKKLSLIVYNEKSSQVFFDLEK